MTNVPLPFKAGPVFHANYDSTADIVIDQGGTDSGKTYAILQILFLIGSTTRAPLVDPIITVLSESVPNAKKGAYRTAKAIYNSSPFLQSRVRDWNESDRIIYFKSGWIMEFVGATDEQNAKQGKRQYLFVNEAQGVPYPIFWQMAKRTRIRTFIDYNPSAPFWAHDKLIGTTREGNDLFATVQLIISDHRHNPFLDERDHAKTENIKDRNLWLVYARGKTGNLIGLIHPNWKMIPDADFPWKEDKKLGGLDFGYTNDPTAGLLGVKIANNIYLHELCYEPGMSATKIAALYKSQGFDRNKPLYCEHDGDMIRQLYMQGLLAVAARKGPNSVNPGIAKVNEYNVFYTASSSNIDFEKKRYMWMLDPVTGKPTNTPVDAFDHLMNAARYMIYSHFYRSAA